MATTTTQTIVSSTEDFTRLHAAAHWGDVAEVQALIDAGEFVNARTTQGYTPLHYATALNHKLNPRDDGTRGARIVEALIAAGADLEARDEKGATPFLFAIMSSNEPVARALIAAGADVHAVSRCGKNALCIASTRGVAGLSVMVPLLTSVGFCA